MKGSITIEYEWNDVPEDCDKQLRDDLEHAALKRACELIAEGDNCGELSYQDYYIPISRKYIGWWENI